MLKAIVFGVMLYLLLRWIQRALGILGLMSIRQAQHRTGGAMGGTRWTGTTSGRGGNSTRSGSRERRGSIDLSRIEEADFEEIPDTTRDKNLS